MLDLASDLSKRLELAHRDQYLLVNLYIHKILHFYMYL